MKKAAYLVLLGVLAVLLAECAMYPTYGPPALRAEARIGRPGPGYFWISGYWMWRGGEYRWHPGYWARERHGRNWVDGRWERRGHRYVWHKGHWR